MQPTDFTDAFAADVRGAVSSAPSTPTAAAMTPSDDFAADIQSAISAPAKTPTDYESKHKQLLSNALDNMGPNGSKLFGIKDTEGVPARLAGYAANVENVVPFLHEGVSAIKASAGGGEGATFPERYESNEQSNQALREAEQKLESEGSGGMQTPKWMPDITASGVGKLGGGLALGAGASAIKAPVDAAMGEAVPGLVKTALKGGLAGAGYGAAYGAGSGNAFADPGQSAWERLGNTIFGASVGVPLGAAAGAAGYGIAKGLTPKSPQLSVGQDPVSPEAAQVLSSVMKRDEPLTAQEMAAELSSNRGQSMTPADVAGPNMKTVLEGLSQRPGEAMSTAERFLNQRNQTAPTRLNEIIEKYIGPLDYWGRRAEQLQKLSAPEIKQAYEDAYDAVPSIDHPKILQIINNLRNTGTGASAWKNAAEAAALEGRSLGTLDEMGQVRNMSTYGVDLLKKELDTQINAEATAGNFNRMSGRGAAILGQKSKMVAELDQLNPAYAAARGQYADEASLISAADMGYRDLWSVPKTGKMISTYENMSGAEQEAFRAGVARKLQEFGRSQAGDNPMANAANPAKNIINNPKTREILSNFFGDDTAKFESFIKQLKAQGNMQETANKLLQGPATARRLAAEKDFEDATQTAASKTAGALRIVIHPKDAAQRVIDNAGHAKREAIGNEIMDIMMNPEYADQMQFLHQIGTYPDKMLRRQQIFNSLMQGGNIAPASAAQRSLVPQAAITYSPVNPQQQNKNK